MMDACVCLLLYVPPPLHIYQPSLNSFSFSCPLLTSFYFPPLLLQFSTLSLYSSHCFLSRLIFLSFSHHFALCPFLLLVFVLRFSLFSSLILSSPLFIHLTTRLSWTPPQAVISQFLPEKSDALSHLPSFTHTHTHTKNTMQNNIHEQSNSTKLHTHTHTL